MLKSILVPIDESKASISALKVACDLAKLSHAKLKGLYVENIARLLEWQPVELIGSAIGASTGLPYAKPTQEQVEIEKEFLKEGEKIKKLFETELSKSNTRGIFITQRGKVDDVIVHLSRTVDFVVTGLNHIKGLHNVGHTTENLLRHTTRPVLVVPEGGKLGKKIIVAYDSSDNAQRALSMAALLTELLNGELQVVSVANEIDNADKPLTEVREFLSFYNIQATYRVGFGAGMPWKSIIEEADRTESDLIVLGAFGSNKLLELIFGSTTYEVLNQTTRPVLLCR